MSKQNWWESTSAADDGARADSIDDDDWLSTFRFEDYEDDDTDSIDDIWGRYGSGYRASSQTGVSAAVSADVADRLYSARKLAQGFVDTFATDTKRYEVTFDESVGTAGTDFDAYKIVISHKPLFDPTLTPSEANAIITAMAAHESSHVRYGRGTNAAVKSQIGTPLAMRVSNILDDSRIERRYSEEFPGYKHIFAPTIAYVAQADAKVAGVERFSAREITGANLISAATRYTDHVDWTDREDERDWWLAWRDRGTASDAPRHHVAAVREALARLAEQDEQREQEKANTASAEQASGGGDSQGQRESSPRDSDEASPSSGEGGQDHAFPKDCFADEVARAAILNQANVKGLPGVAAQRIANLGGVLSEPDEFGSRGAIYRNPKGVVKRRRVLEAPRGSSAIRSAFVRSRRGRNSRERGHTTGRLDNASLHKVARCDRTVFARRLAPSEPKYRVWLMVDCSGSMGGSPIIDAASVASALASASRFLPNVSLDIWGWSTGPAAAAFRATRVWTTGADIRDLGFLPSLVFGGTPDAEVLRWAGRAIVDDLRRDERGMIIMASDGKGSLIGNRRAHGVSEVVDQVRRRGVQVVSVAIGAISPHYQAEMYGDRYFIPWQGSITATAGPLGRLIASAAEGNLA